MHRPPPVSSSYCRVGSRRLDVDELAPSKTAAGIRSHMTGGVRRCWWATLDSNQLSVPCQESALSSRASRPWFRCRKTRSRSHQTA